ncbi:NAD-dependent epimerase/dehydratase family protein [Ligilactobacillus acidipiscis]|nr:NAD-dependent epimerase/dehydratase family protein [Ligilactobacillus acidipiscis]
MKIVVIGAYGHIGSYLVPKLVKNNNEVIAVSRGKHQPYTQDSSWKKFSI